MWISKSDGSDRRELIANSLRPALPSFRPGSDEIVFVSQPPGAAASRLCAISASGGAIRDVISEPFSVSTPSWSRDGKTLLYSADSDDPSHTGLYLMDWDTKQKRKIPGSEGYWKARISPDGKWIVSVFSDLKSLGLYEFASHTWTTVAHAEVLSPVAWSSDSRSFYFQDLLEKNEPVRRYSLAAHKSDIVMDCKPLLDGGVMRCGFEDILPDGSFLLQLTRGDHDVYSFDLKLP